jgi:hypothetical protein
MSGFFMRIANYIANELIVKGLANNKNFQRFALRTATHVEKLQKEGVQHQEKVASQVKEHVGFMGKFFAALRAEVNKDLAKFKK